MVAETNDDSAIIEHLADKYTREILCLTAMKEYSAIELSAQLNTSISTAYRKLKLLEHSGLIQHVKTVINLVGNEEKYYRCTIREATVSFKDGKLLVSLKKEDYSDKLIRLWKRFANLNSK